MNKQQKMQLSETIFSILNIAYSRDNSPELAETLAKSQGLEKEYEQAKKYFSQDFKVVRWACNCILDKPAFLFEDAFLYAYFRAEKRLDIWIPSLMIKPLAIGEAYFLAKRIENLLHGKLKLITIRLKWDTCSTPNPHLDIQCL